MTRKFFPGCKVKNRYPEASQWLADRGIFVAIDPDDIHGRLVEHCASIEPDEVVCYCTACDAGLEDGGKDAKNLLELISGKFRD